MKCPKCNAKARIVNNSFNEEQNEMYRKHICKVCNSIFFTTEFIVEPSKQFALDWYANQRSCRKTIEELKEVMDYYYCEKAMGEDYASVFLKKGKD